MKLKKCIALLASLLLVFGLSGCLANVYQTTGTIDGYEISSGLYLMAQFTAYGEAQELAQDPEKDVFSQQVEGQNAKSWIDNRTEELLRRYVAVRRLTRERDIIMDEIGQQNLDQMMQYWSYLEQMYAENGVSVNSFQRFITTDELSRVLFANLYGQGGERAVTDDELKAAYAEQYAHVRMISMPATSNEEGVSVREDVINACRAMLEKLQAGSTLEEIAKTDVADVYELVGREYDIETAEDDIFDTWVNYTPDESETYSEEELALLKSQVTGDYGIVITESTVMLYEKRDIFDDEASFEDRRETVLEAVKREDYENYLEEIYSAYEVTWAFLARWNMSPKKITTT